MSEPRSRSKATLTPSPSPSPEEQAQQQAQQQAHEEAERTYRLEGLNRAQSDATRRPNWKTVQILQVARAYSDFLRDGTIPADDPEVLPKPVVTPA